MKKMAGVLIEEVSTKFDKSDALIILNVLLQAKNFDQKDMQKILDAIEKVKSRKDLVDPFAGQYKKE